MREWFARRGLEAAVPRKRRCAALRCGAVAAAIVAAVAVPATAGSATYRPLVPRDVRAIAGVASALVTYVRPESPGRAPITAYQVWPTPDAFYYVCRATRCRIPDLTPGASYVFAVRALNRYGPGPFAPRSNRIVVDAAAPVTTTTMATTPTCCSASLPSVPGDLTLTSGPDELVASWSAASSNGGGPVIYTATAAPGGFTCTTTTTTCAITGLAPDTEYTVFLTASNVNGTVPAQDPVPDGGTIAACEGSTPCDPGPVAASYPTYGNVAPDDLGDCTFAAAANWEQIVLGAAPDPTVVGYEFAQAGGTATGGLSQSALWSYWSHDGIGGVFLTSRQAYYADEIDVENAVADFGALLAELRFRDGWGFAQYTQTAGLHEVVVDGVTPQGPLVVSWGETLQMTWEQWNAEVVALWGLTTSGTPT